MENDNLSGFENDFELISVHGRTGDLIVNNNRKKNKEITIKAYVDLEGLGDAKTVANNINNWLVGDVSYKPLNFSDDLTNYEAIVVGKVSIEEVIEGLLEISFKFNCKPSEVI